MLSVYPQKAEPTFISPWFLSLSEKTTLQIDIGWGGFRGVFSASLTNSSKFIQDMLYKKIAAFADFSSKGEYFKLNLQQILL